VDIYAALKQLPSHLPITLVDGGLVELHFQQHCNVCATGEKPPTVAVQQARKHNSTSASSKRIIREEGTARNG
jgi:hypothetical protein